MLEIRQFSADIASILKAGIEPRRGAGWTWSTGPNLISSPGSRSSDRSRAPWSSPGGSRAREQADTREPPRVLLGLGVSARPSQWRERSTDRSDSQIGGPPPAVGDVPGETGVGGGPVLHRRGLAASRDPGGLAARSSLAFYALATVRDVADGARTGADADEHAGHLQGALCVADAPARGGRHPRTCAFLDARRALSRGHGSARAAAHHATMAADGSLAARRRGRGILVDVWPRPLPLAVAPAARPSHVEANLRLDLALGDALDTIALYRAMQHRRPLINGYSGVFPPALLGADAHPRAKGSGSHSTSGGARLDRDHRGSRPRPGRWMAATGRERAVGAPRPHRAGLFELRRGSPFTNRPPRARSSMTSTDRGSIIS